ncbi:60S ribosomal protein L31 [Drechslerella dactyloides]|uniref:60S ribosomal protein L31 n=1 Tax=Drechslerella dactyloides TaxID=74499 RepID=A0AAD6J433_DREDA|nr:60S ribosomal protein L31 [Drechslerella dactyloides]
MGQTISASLGLRDPLRYTAPGPNDPHPPDKILVDHTIGIDFGPQPFYVDFEDPESLVRELKRYNIAGIIVQKDDEWEGTLYLIGIDAMPTSIVHQATQIHAVYAERTIHARYFLGLCLVTQASVTQVSKMNTPAGKLVHIEVLYPRLWRIRKAAIDIIVTDEQRYDQFYIDEIEKQVNWWTRVLFTVKGVLITTESTFNGIVKEFPQIQFDYFRKVSGQQPSLANFLSHIHSDHLLGLAGKSYRAPFIYCSAATKNLLLKLERRLHRLNYAKKLVESHEYTYLDYAKRERILRELPLETPTEIELCPGYTIRVTLFDANHCPGSTMFLVEGNSKAILYTGDIRAEPWWLEKLKRNPILLPYCRGIKVLDCLYLDTTHASFEASHLRFSPKADGIADLLATIAKYPPSTIFHLNTWTTGYEDAWVALAAHFNAQIHLDDYRLRLYNAIGKKEEWEHGPYLLGDSMSDSILTDDRSVRFHSCERWLECEVRDRARSEGKLVEISPLVAKYRDVSGVEYLLREPGESGGNIDANAVDEVSGDQLLELATAVKDRELNTLIDKAGVKPGFNLPLNAPAPDTDITPEKFLQLLKQNLEALLQARQQEQVKTENPSPKQDPDNLPSWFGYACSRHSSFSELQEVVKTLAPRDVYPCVAAEGSWYQKDSIRKLFGRFCRGDTFAFDLERDLDRSFVKPGDKQRQDEIDLAEQRAAGMEDSSQQARSQQYSSQDSLQDGTTRADDISVWRGNAAEVEADAPVPTFPQGETQLDPYDPDIRAKVAKALEEGRALSRSIMGSDSTPRQNGIPNLQPASFGDEEGIALVLSENGSYRSFTTPRKRPAPPQPPVAAIPQPVFQPLRYSQLSTTASTVSSRRHVTLDESDEMDCSQDSLEDQSLDELDREEVRSVMRAVEEGQWDGKSRDLYFNAVRWRKPLSTPNHQTTVDTTPITYRHPSAEMAPPKSGKTKPGRSAIADVVTREYTIHMHKRVHGVSFKKRAPKAIKEIKEFAHKQMGTIDVRLDPQLNKEVWKQGIKGVPYRLRIRISRKRNDEENAKEKLYSFVEAVNVKNPKGLHTTVIDA